MSVLACGRHSTLQVNIFIFIDTISILLRKCCTKVSYKNVSSVEELQISTRESQLYRRRREDEQADITRTAGCVYRYVKIVLLCNKK